MQVGGIPVKPAQVCGIDSPYGPFHTSVILPQIRKARVFRRQFDLSRQLVLTPALIHSFQGLFQYIINGPPEIPQDLFYIIIPVYDACMPRKQVFCRI